MRSKDGKIHHTKFWSLVDLPTFDWLIGNSMLNRLGWQLSNKYFEYHHRPQAIDYGEDELETLTCSNYPVENEPKIDVSQIRVTEPLLEQFIHDTLNRYQSVLAKHEFDSGKIIANEFPIDFISDPHPLKEGFLSREYTMSPHNKIEVQKQIDGMRRYDLIEKCKNPQWVSCLFCVPKKTGDVRVVFDYRKLNLITRKIQHPIPDTEKLLQRFKGKKFITSLDLKGASSWIKQVSRQKRHISKRY